MSEAEGALTRAFPRPEIMSIEGFVSDEIAQYRNAWLDESFWEEWATSINRIRMVSPFVLRDDSRMSRKDSNRARPIR